MSAATRARRQFHAVSHFAQGAASNTVVELPATATARFYRSRASFVRKQVQAAAPMGGSDVRVRMVNCVVMTRHTDSRFMLAYQFDCDGRSGTFILEDSTGRDGYEQQCL